MFNFGEQSLKKLEGVHPDLVKVMKLAIINSPYDFSITQGIRTAEYQNNLFQQGRTKNGQIVTYCDGYIKKSNHQAKSDGYGYALDIAIYNPKLPGKLDYDTNKLKEVAELILNIAKEKKYNIEWGGNWKRFKDYPHFELKTK